MRLFALLTFLLSVGTVFGQLPQQGPVVYQSYVPTGACPLPNYLTIVTVGVSAGVFQCKGTPTTWQSIGGGGSSGFPITLGSTAVAANSIITELDGLNVNGVTLNGAGSSTLFLNQAGGYTTPAGGGTLTAVSVATANGVSGTSSGGTTPALTIVLGAIAPTSTNGVSAATMAFVDPTSSIQTQLNGKQATLTLPLSVANGGTGAATAAANSVFGNFTGTSAAPGFTAAPTFSAANLTNFPTLNQSTSGNAATATALASAPTLCTTGNAPTGILANGNATGCAAIGAGSTVFQVNGVGLTSSTTVNFLNSAATNGLTLTFTNPSLGGVQLGFTGTLTNAGLTNSAVTIAGTSVALGGSTSSLPSPGAIGGTTPSTAAFTTLSASSTVSGTGFSTYLASPPAIGGTAPGTGAFTTLSASSTVSGTGFSTYLASPPAIGGTAPAAGHFTTLTATGTISSGASPPTACGSASGCFAVNDSGTAGTPTSAQSYIYVPTGTNLWTWSLNGAAETSVWTAAQGGTGVANTATLTLGSSNQNWATLGTGIVKNTTTTGALTDAASADVITLWSGTCNSSSFLRGDGACAAAGGSLPTGTTGQVLYYAAGGTTATASSALTITSASAGFAFGVGMTPVTQFDLSGTTSQIAPYTGTVTLGATFNATATSATISGGAALNPNGGFLLVGYQDGSNDQEIICYSAATSTTLTLGAPCGTPVTTIGRSYFGTTAASHASGNQIVQILSLSAASITTTPRWMTFGNGGNGDSTWGSLNPNTLGHNTGTMIGDTLYIAGNGACLSSNPTNTNLGLCLTLANGSLEWSNTASNPALITAPASLDYAITTQAITGNGTLTAITNAKTPTMPNNNTTAAAGTGGVLSSHCMIIWNQATSGTVGFGVKASAAPTDLWVKEQDQIGTALAPVFTTITSTTTTATSGTVTPTAFGTTYAADIWLAMNPGTSNSVSVQLYAQASANTITIEPGTGCTAWQ